MIRCAFEIGDVTCRGVEAGFAFSNDESEKSSCLLFLVGGMGLGVNFEGGV